MYRRIGYFLLSFLAISYAEPERDKEIPYYVGIGKTCDKLERFCAGNSVCHNSVCTCPVNTKQFGRECVPTIVALPGESCELQQMCLGFSHCIDGVCRCVEGTRTYRGRCISPGQELISPSVL